MIEATQSFKPENSEVNKNVPEEILKSIPQLVPLTQGHFAALETALGSMGRDIGTAINVAYSAYGEVVEKYLALVAEDHANKDEVERDID